MVVVGGVVVRALLLAAVAAAAAEALSLDVHHRYSPAVRRWAASPSPVAGTVEYYAALAGHDLRRRSLAAGAGAGAEFAFADGNDTYRLNDFGFLHYAVVALGTPNVTFLVALDTGSDLFWVPCDCLKCAPLQSPSYGNLKFDVYSPSESTTSRKVPCSSSLCDLQNACRSKSNSCPYSIQYLSDNTSSSGVLVEDVLYLTSDSAQSKTVAAPIMFGCGQVQTGSFLGSAAPNGLLGLGMDSKSIPSLLASKGLAANSFSMCFGEDGHGRINFGDTGSSDQKETPLNSYKQTPYYNITITGITVGAKSINTEFAAIVDSGTSFTALSDPMYTQITSSFDAQVHSNRNQLDSTMPFEFCYSISSNRDAHPNVSLTAKGGGIFPVNDPIITITDNAFTPIGYCLAIMKSEGVNLIGENFMSGLKVIFDRERMVLGYNFDQSSRLPVNTSPSAVPPKSGLGPSSYTPEAAKGALPNGTQINATPSASSPLQLHFRSFLDAIILLFFADKDAEAQGPLRSAASLQPILAVHTRTATRDPTVQTASFQVEQGQFRNSTPQNPRRARRPRPGRSPLPPLPARTEAAPYKALRLSSPLAGYPLSAAAAASSPPTRKEPSQPTAAVQPQFDGEMDRYQRVEKPREEAPIKENEIRITTQGRMRNYITYATTLLQDKGSDEVVFKAMGRAINKTVMIAELIKRRIVGLHQNTTTGSTDITDMWEPLEEGLLPLETTRHVSMITITLSKKELDTSSIGYQSPLPADKVKPLMCPHLLAEGEAVAVEVVEGEEAEVHVEMVTWTMLMVDGRMTMLLQHMRAMGTPVEEAVALGAVAGEVVAMVRNLIISKMEVTMMKHRQFTGRPKAVVVVVVEAAGEAHSEAEDVVATSTVLCMLLQLAHNLYAAIPKLLFVGCLLQV
uniref:Peptidase A1 domain-containing protein n=1 Tax=Leersia perrieri TaxID=77586 RepID=A0A0D9XG71_9ORYZ